MDLKDEIQLAIQAHAMWKINLLKVIEAGESSLDPVDVHRDDLCTFGQWLFGDTIPESAKAMTEYGVCVQLHKDFHELTSSILRLALDGRRKDALDALSEPSLYCELSATLIQYMKLWQARWAQSLLG